MSLLIKALASAEKDKQAELNKKSHNLRHEASLALELASIEMGNIVETAQPVANSANEKLQVNTEEYSTLSLASDDELSLADEAGLSASMMASKAKSSTNKAKAKEAGFTSQLQTVEDDSVASTAASAAHTPENNHHQKVAASVFVANQAIKTPGSKVALVALGVAGVLMIWLGLQGYQYISALTAPDIVVVKPASPAAQIEDVPINVSSTALDVDQNASAGQDLAVISVDEARMQNQPVTKVDELPAIETESVFSVNDRVADARLSSAKKMRAQPSENTKQFNDNNNADDVDDVPAQGSSQGATKRAPLKLVRKTPVAGVDPTLLAAYQAFSRGDDASAQQQYRQVLQRDVRNVDALLGMAAIAQRQGRDADAAGWYQEVLGIEPRNTIAQSAVVRLQVNADVVGSESRFKNLLAQQPESANVHAALGNLYAEQNQWASAQAAYFNASRFAPNNADYAFNLAVSLDHLGKSNLALVQYQRALELLNSSGAASPDRVQLETRINALR